MGRVDLRDTQNGVFVEFIENLHPDMYSGLGKTADQIEVEHCINRGLDRFEINSHAELNSHVAHYKRGKRFGKILSSTIEQEMLKRFQTIDANIIVKKIIDTATQGE